MEKILLIIAIVEVIRVLQNSIQLFILVTSNSKKNFDRATDAFINSLDTVDQKFVDKWLEDMRRANKIVDKWCEEEEQE